MPTPDRFPGVREEEEIKLVPESSDPTLVGAFRLVSGDFRMRDNHGVFNPRDAAAFDVDDILVSADGAVLTNSDGNVLIHDG